MGILSPNNPLAKHFRQPILYVKLPSNGRWYAEGSLELPVNGEIPIYAMTAKDEITLKTPDALLNGASTVHTIASCCPSIKDPWKMPLVDLDTVLISIRIASYGNEMEFTCKCPKCNTTVEKGLDLSVILDKIKLANWDKEIKFKDLVIRLKPQTYEEYNKNNMTNFEEQRILQLIRDQEIPDDEKTAKFDEMFRKLLEAGIGQVCKSIASISVEDTVVTDPDYIVEFFNNCDRNIWEEVKKELELIKESAKYTEVNITCTNDECKEDFITPFVFEQTNFFG